MEKASKILAAIGLVVAIAGFIANDIYTNFSLYFTIMEIFALLCFIFYFLVNFNLVKAFSKQRSAKYGATSLLGIIIFIAILVIANRISTFHTVIYDLTKARTNSLSDQTIKVLEGVKKDITITAFFKKNSREKADMEGFLKIYQDYTDKIKVDFVDPDLQPAISRQYNVRKLFTTVFQSGEKEYRIEPESPEGLEGLITNAIIRVSREKKKVIYFTTDHNEPSIDDQTGIGLSFIKKHLEGLNYDIKKVSLLKEGKIPDDCAVLVISNPSKPFMENELQLLEGYINKDGKLIFLSDINSDQGILNFLAKYGLHFNSDIIMDNGNQLLGADFSMPLVKKYHAEEPITKGFSQVTLYSVARSIAFTEDFQPWRKYVALATTNDLPSVWGETNLKDLKNVKFDEGQDGPGPLEIVGLLTYSNATKNGEKQISATKSEDVCEIVAFGDSDFISNNYLNFFGNTDFFTNTINYLARELDLISVTPKKALSSPVLLSDSQKNFLYYFAIFIFPATIFISGIAMWLRRRNL